MESVKNCAWASQADRREYHFRLGALLYLLHILRGVDFHPNNVIGDRDQPVFFDCETLLHPNIWMPAAARWYARDILRTGLLPAVSSALDCEHPEERWRGVPLRRKRARIISTDRASDGIAEGFKTMHEFLGRKIASKRQLDGMVRDRFPTVTRYIRRPTRSYLAILDHSNANHLLRDGCARHSFLKNACQDGLVPKTFVDTEVDALEDGDIPIFHGAAATPRPKLSKEALERSLRLLRDCLEQGD